MTSQVINDFQFEAPQTFMLRDILPGPAWAPFRPEAPAPASDTDTESQPDLAQEFHPRGIVIALCLEIGMVFACYCVWEFWKFIR